MLRNCFFCKQGSILLSHFSAIFDNFRQKNCRFSQKNNVMVNFFEKFSFVMSQNANFFRRFFWRKKIVTSVPGSPNWANVCNSGDFEQFASNSSYFFII
jgi:hypothetical protein